MSERRKIYKVYLDDELALEITEGAGPLVSRTAPPPLPGTEPAMHPFLSATAFMPHNEGRLRELLDQSGSLAEYLSLLQQNGFRIVGSTPQVSGEQESNRPR